MADMGGIYAFPFTKLILEHPAGQRTDLLTTLDKKLCNTIITSKNVIQCKKCKIILRIYLTVVFNSVILVIVNKR